MSAKTDRNAAVVLSRDPGDYSENTYRQWHQDVVNIAKRHDGLVDVNLQEPIEGVQDQWVEVITFNSPESLKALLGDEAYTAALSKSELTFGKPITQQVVVNSKPSTVPVTVVVSQLLKPGCADAYQNWQLDIDAAAKKFPGFLGTEMIKPMPGVQNEWVVVFRFDSAKNLDDWLASNTHAELMKQAEPLFEKVQVRRVGRGFEDWIANAAGGGDDGPSQVRMAMVVLLALYPIVMLLTLYLVPLLPNWGLAYSMFISNILSVVLLTWIFMPLTTRALGFWLDRDTGSKTGITLLGGALILCSYAASVAIFKWLAG